MDAFDNAIQLNPKNPEYHNDKGRVFYGLGEEEEALSEFKNAAPLNPDNYDYLVFRDSLLYELREKD